MGRIEYEVIEALDARDAADVNSIWTAIETESALVDQENLAEEGLDHRTLPFNPVGKTIEVVSAETRAGASLAVAASYTQLVFSGTTFRTVGVLPALAADEAYRVRFRCWYESTVGAGVGLTATTMQHQLWWHDGISAAALPFSERKVGLISGSTVQFDADFFCEGWLFGTEATVSWFEARYLMAAGLAFPANAALWVTKFNRANKV